MPGRYRPCPQCVRNFENEEVRGRRAHMCTQLYQAPLTTKPLILAAPHNFHPHALCTDNYITYTHCCFC